MGFYKRLEDEFRKANFYMAVNIDAEDYKQHKKEYIMIILDYSIII